MSCDVDAAVVGAGPVGLFLGCCLQAQGLSFVLLERRAAPSRHTRAIGVHPPALELLDRLGLAQPLVRSGTRIRRGAVHSGSKRLGCADFSRGPGPFGFVLAVPQYETERILLDALPSGAVRRGVECVGLDDRGDSIRVTAHGAQGELRWNARHVVGCDGGDSSVRKLLGIRFAGGDYPGRFAMGDFGDTTNWGDEARILLDGQGFMESFPLPGDRRRWVLYGGETDPTSFRAEVERRCGIDPGSPIAPLTDFVAQHFLAQSFARGRVALAGDAAHVMSPIGGQGLNVGWFDAWDLAQAFAGDQDLESYARRARERAERAIRRGAQNLAIGKGGRAPWLRTALVFAGLHAPIQPWLVRRITLRGI
jgi:2-polyprenyl-6-methoxyphenol hydroxylase-like FAD-dependent oxidoreductase